MFYCSECEMIIRDEDVDVFKQGSKAWGHTVYEDITICPKCGEVVGVYEGEPYKEEYENEVGALLRDVCRYD